MVEMLVGNIVPMDRGVTRGAGGFVHLFVVRRRMARPAVVERLCGKIGGGADLLILQSRMTFLTGNCSVQADERKPGHVVIERGCRCPAFRRMAIAAPFPPRERRFMRRSMAGSTVIK